jgi:hypothetical protein
MVLPYTGRKRQRPPLRLKGGRSSVLWKKVQTIQIIG